MLLEQAKKFCFTVVFFKYTQNYPACHAILREPIEQNRVCRKVERGVSTPLHRPTTNTPQTLCIQIRGKLAPCTSISNFLGTADHVLVCLQDSEELSDEEAEMKIAEMRPPLIEISINQPKVVTLSKDKKGESFSGSAATRVRCALLAR